MAYSKNTWANGDVITAAKLNNIEDGVAANDSAIAGHAPLAVVATVGADEEITLDKSAGELYEAVSAGKTVKLVVEISEGLTSEQCVHIEATKLDNEGTVVFEFRYVSTDGTAYSVSSLGENDTVVLTPES